MYPLIDCSPQQIFTLASECGFSDQFGQLITPLTNYRIHPECMFAIDNGGFSKACPRQYRNVLKKAMPYQSRCLWATLPDVPGDARRTLELFRLWHSEVSGMGYKIALVAQDGLENEEIPWLMLDTIFIGGTTEWKMSDHAKNVIRSALWIGKTVHVGRINTGSRWEEFQKTGAHTFDGSGLARPYPGSRENRRNIAMSRSATFASDTCHAPTAVVTGSVADHVQPVENQLLLPI